MIDMTALFSTLNFGLFLELKCDTTQMSIRITRNLYYTYFCSYNLHGNIVIVCLQAYTLHVTNWITFVIVYCCISLFNRCCTIRHISTLRWAVGQRRVAAWRQPAASVTSRRTRPEVSVSIAARRSFATTTGRWSTSETTAQLPHPSSAGRSSLFSWSAL